MMGSIKWLFIYSVVAVGCDSNLDVKTIGGVAVKPAVEESNQDLPAKLLAEDCVDPNLNEVSTSVSLTLCNGEMAQGLLDLSELKPEHIKTGVTIAGVLGSAILESHNDCVADGAVGCVTTNDYKSANMAVAVPQYIKSGISIAGVTGHDHTPSLLPV